MEVSQTTLALPATFSSLLQVLLAAMVLQKIVTVAAAQKKSSNHCKAVADLFLPAVVSQQNSIVAITFRWGGSLVGIICIEFKLRSYVTVSALLVAYNVGQTEASSVGQ
jgi:hypothetical protein